MHIFRMKELENETKTNIKQNKCTLFKVNYDKLG